MKIGKIESVKIREVWNNEPKDFTPWLAKNLDVLTDTLGFNLTYLNKEDAVGPYRVDIVAEHDDSSIAIIENQYGKTNHPHLGQLLTYLANREAKHAIWICEEPSSEHIKTINWINEYSPADTFFYLIKLQIYKIGESLPAPQFTLVAGPSPESKSFGENRKEDILRQETRRKFWDKLLIKSRLKTDLFQGNNGTKNNFIGSVIGPGLTLTHVINSNDSRIELNIYFNDKEKNKRVFDAIFSHKTEIENIFGSELDWQRKEDTIVSKIVYSVSKDIGWKQVDKWDYIQDKMIENMIKFHKSLESFISEIE